MNIPPKHTTTIGSEVDEEKTHSSENAPPKLTLQISDVTHVPQVAKETLRTKNRNDETTLRKHVPEVFVVRPSESVPETLGPQEECFHAEKKGNATMLGRHQPEAVVTSPLGLAPEVVLKSPSDFSPELSLDMFSGKEMMPKVEEKIVYIDDKIFESDGRQDSFDEKIAQEQENHTAVERKVPWHRKRRYHLLLVGALVILLCLVGSTAWLGVRQSRSGAQPANKEVVAAGLAATQWLDREGVKHYRVYFQDKNNEILESAWDSNSTGWKVSTVANAEMGVRRDTPIGAMNGWPHADYSFNHVKQIYYVGSNEAIFERATNSSPTNAWYNDNFSGLFRASQVSSLTTYWAQNLTNGSQELLAMFQAHDGPDVFSIARYYEYQDQTRPWSSVRYNFSTLRGSPLAMVPRTYPQFAYDLLLYAANPQGQLAQYRYNIRTGDAQENGVVIAEPVISPGLPLTVVAQNDTAFFATRGYYPECARVEPLTTHLILYANLDRSSLVLNSLNCSHGLINQTAKIAGLVGRNRRYLGLTSHSDGKVYVEYDQGSGREMEEWTVPRTSLDDWKLSSQVKTKIENGKL